MNTDEQKLCTSGPERFRKKIDGHQ